MIKSEVIINYIKNCILDESIKPGQKLPSIRNICDQFQCSKVTAVKVYDLLEKQHIVYSIPKSGHYLIENNLNLNNNVFNSNINFSTSISDSCLLPYEEFQHCLNQSINLYKKCLFSHSETRGLENLIYAISKQLQDYQVFTDKQDLFITTGSQQAINILTMMKFPNNKKNVLIEQPTYQGIIKSLELNTKSDPIYALDYSSRVIYLKTYSKILFPELRIAAVVLPRVLVNTFQEYKKWTDLNTSILSQGALEIYIKNGTCRTIK